MEVKITIIFQDKIIAIFFSSSGNGGGGGLSAPKPSRTINDPILALCFVALAVVVAVAAAVVVLNLNGDVGSCPT